MRALVLDLVVVILCLVGVVRPRYGLYGYIWFALMRPDNLAWVENQHSYSMYICCSTLVGCFLTALPNFSALIRNPFVPFYLILQTLHLLSAVFAIVPHWAFVPLGGYMGTVTMTLMIPVLITSVKDLRQLLIVMAASFGAIGLKYGVINLLHGGTQITWGYAGFHGDNNTLGLGLVLVLPLCWFTRYFLPPLWAKVMTFTVFSTTAAAIMTHSRATAICIVLCYLILMAREKRKLLAALSVVVMIVPTLYLVWTSFTERLATMETMQEGSAQARMGLARMGLSIWKDHPVHGVGFGTANQVALNSQYLGVADPHVLHNNYLQIAVDSGTPALLVYCCLLFGGIFWHRRSIQRMKKTAPECVPIPAMLQCSLVVFAVGSFFISRTTYDFSDFLIVGCTAAWYNLERLVLAQPAPVAMPAQTVQFAINRVRRSRTEPVRSASTQPI
jgi:probable O-glycosylation ligase (exosortase A-associated)